MNSFMNSFSAACSSRGQSFLRLACILSTILLACGSLLARNLPLHNEHSSNSMRLAPLPQGAGLRLSPPSGGDGDMGAYRQYSSHNQGNIQLTLSSWGSFGVPVIGLIGLPPVLADTGVADPFTGERIYACTFPSNSDICFRLSAVFFIGGIAKHDTLVSSEFRSDPPPFGGFRYQTVDDRRDYYSKDAFSELDIICTYYDTVTDTELVQSFDLWDRRHHIPMGLKVEQTSMSWGVPQLEDFILFKYEITNIGEKYLSDCFVGVTYMSNVRYRTRALDTATINDDLIGFLRSHPSPEGCGFDVVDIAYVMDNDGDPVEGQFDSLSPLGAVGIGILHSPSDSDIVNFNWWAGTLLIAVTDTGRWPAPSGTWGPRKRGTPDDPFRPTGLELGVPIGDRNWYYVMRHPEFDYDQIACAIDHLFAGWLPPPDTADDIADGKLTYALLSSGPFDLGPGQSADFSIAVVGGENVHTDPTAFEQLFHPLNPWPFYNQLDFSDFALNTRWARWVYDNPGVDTDGDGYFGEFLMCEGDTFWYEGDGVPDFRADFAPLAPEVRIMTSTGKLIIRWNGYYCETNIDFLTRVRDFEGYRVYVGLDSRRSSLSLLSSYDRENYNRYRYIHLPNGLFRWSCDEVPFTLDSLKILYDNPDFEPLCHPRENPWRYNDTLYYFTKQDFNVSNLLDSAEIHKAYPDAVDPGTDTSLWTEDDLTCEHGKPLPKFYEYEYIYDNLLPTVTYYVGVTSFDFGFTKGGIPAKESNLLNNLIVAYAQTSADSVEEYQLDAYVYPNPYLYDAHYHRQGFENRDRKQIPARSRRIHFANLPKVCKISIYSLDGDLIRELDHYYPEGGPDAMHDSWDLITRNTQAVVAGLYYFVIESEHRTQIGKFVIIM